MFWSRRQGRRYQEKKEPPRPSPEAEITVNALRQLLADMSDAEIIERRSANNQPITLLYIKTLIDQERLNEAVVQPLLDCTRGRLVECMANARVQSIRTLGEAQEQLLHGGVLFNDIKNNSWQAIKLEIQLSRSIESSETETILYGPKDSFSEQLEQNMTLIRRRLPLSELKSEQYTVGTLSKTTVVLMYIEGLTSPEIIDIARSKIASIDFDLLLDSSNVAVFMEDHYHSLFPQFLLTDRPDSCAYSLGIGKLVFLVGNTPFALVAPITFFHLFQSPEDYIHRWLVASFLRSLRFFSFFLSLTLIPMYVALTYHHYQMIPLQILYVLLESRSNLPFTPFWEGLFMIVTLEIIKEASLRMPTKTSQTLGVIGGIVIGQAAVEAGFASKVMIVLMGISGIASFLVPNYLVTKTVVLIQTALLLLSAFLGVMGIALGMIAVLAHLNGLTSLRQPYLSPISPFYGKDWVDLFIRGPFHWMKTRPDYLFPLQKWRYNRRR